MDVQQNYQLFMRVAALALRAETSILAGTIRLTIPPSAHPDAASK
jgi:hypothetical protein